MELKKRPLTVQTSYKDARGIWSEISAFAKTYDKFMQCTCERASFYVQFMPCFKPKQGMGSNVTVLAAEQHELNYPNRDEGYISMSWKEVFFLERAGRSQSNEKLAERHEE